MPRSVDEWVGKTDDTPVPGRVKVRVFQRCKGCCHRCGRKIPVGDQWGINYAIRQLCEILDVDPHSISWDAATETMARRINRRPHLALAICRSAGLA